WQLVVGNGLAVLDVDLSKDLVVAIENDAGRFHLLQLVQVEGSGLVSQLGQTHRNINCQPPNQKRRDDNRHIKFWPRIPGRAKPIAGRRDKITAASLSFHGKGANTQRST